MAINDVTGEWVYLVRDILHEFLGQNFVSGLRTLNHKKLVFFSPALTATELAVIFN